MDRGDLKPISHRTQVPNRTLEDPLGMLEVPEYVLAEKKMPKFWLEFQPGDDFIYL